MFVSGHCGETLLGIGMPGGSIFGTSGGSGRLRSLVLEPPGSGKAYILQRTKNI